MSENLLSKLSEGEVACLRLVLTRTSSKEIARDLGISPHTVDQRLRTAIRKLGVSSRFEAARMLAARSDEPYQPLMYQQPRIAGARRPVESLSTSSPRDRQEQAQRVDAVQEDQSFILGSGTSLPLTSPTFLPSPGEQNDLSTAHRLLAILLLAIAIALGFGAVVAGYEALVRLTA